ncbi:hypothetical protein BDW68DRAFT_179307 [Aspergillus falconensis]
MTHGSLPSVFTNYNGTSHIQREVIEPAPRFQETSYIAIRPHDTEKEPLLWEVARATSAAPIFFRPVTMDTGDFWDGALGFPNPTKLARWEGNRLWPNAVMDVAISLGTGEEPKHSISGNSRSRLIDSFNLLLDGEFHFLNLKAGSKTDRELLRLNTKLSHPIRLDDTESFQQQKNYIFSRASYFRGVAKIPLQNFDFERIIPGVRTIRESHVQALVRTFESEGCLRLNPDNYVKVIIAENALQQCLTQQDLSEDDLHGEQEPHFLNLPPGEKVVVLQGRHRLLAAERFLWDKWWIARLYSEELAPEFQQVLKDEHPNAQKYCDGDIYRNIRYHQRQGDADAELKWRGRLTKNTQRLWQSLKLSYLSRWLCVQSPEELMNYFNRMYNQWSEILGGISPRTLDPDTVGSLETLIPEYSLHDRALIKEMVEKRTIFPLLGDDQRQGILDRILSPHLKGCSQPSSSAQFL